MTIDISFDELERIATRKVVSQWPLDDQTKFWSLYPGRGQASPAFGASRVPDQRRRGNIANTIAPFITFVANNYPHLANCPFEQRVEAEVIADYCDILPESCSDKTIVQYLDDLRRYAAACRWPAVADDRWLKLKANEFDRRTTPWRTDLLQFDASNLWAKASHYLDELERRGATTHFSSASRHQEAALLYRDILLVGFLTLIPLRLRNITHLEWQRHLQKRPQGIALKIGATEMKNRMAYEVDLPLELIERLHFYRDHVVPYLCGSSPESKRVWVTSLGTGMLAGGVHLSIERTTLKIFNYRLTAHDFRHICAATAAKNGANRQAIAALLQHAYETRAVERYVAHWSPKPTNAHRDAFDMALAAK